MKNACESSRVGGVQRDFLSIVLFFFFFFQKEKSCIRAELRRFSRLSVWFLCLSFFLFFFFQLSFSLIGNPFSAFDFFFLVYCYSCLPHILLFVFPSSSLRSLRNLYGLRTYSALPCLLCSTYTWYNVTWAGLGWAT